MEGLGYDFVEVGDHVLRVNVASRPNWEGGRATSASVFHDPFVLFGFLGFQRQTALAAKQAASLDVLCGGRFRLGIVISGDSAPMPGSRCSRSGEGIAPFAVLADKLKPVLAANRQ